MISSGFAEAQASYDHTAATALVGQVRRFGDVGPAYEVVDVASSGNVVIAVIESGERLEYGLSEFLVDPVALTIP
jgi:hypothetical protein